MQILQVQVILRISPIEGLPVKFRVEADVPLTRDESSAERRAKIVMAIQAALVHAVFNSLEISSIHIKKEIEVKNDNKLFP